MQWSGISPAPDGETVPHELTPEEIHALTRDCDIRREEQVDHTEGTHSNWIIYVALALIALIAAIPFIWIGVS